MEDFKFKTKFYEIQHNTNYRDNWDTFAELPKGTLEHEAKAKFQAHCRLWINPECFRLVARNERRDINIIASL